jgi:hypothetical protein
VIPLHPALHACALATALAVLVPRAAAAQPAASDAAVVRAGSPVTLIVELAPGSPIDEGRLQTAVASELGISIVRERGATGGTLVVRQEGDTVTVSFDGPSGRRHDSRTLSLDPAASRAEQDIALVAVNVSRDQAAAFLTPAEPPPPPTTPAAPAPVAAPAAALAPCARLHASRQPRTLLAVDFVPYAGTSSFEGTASIRTISIGALGAASSGVDGAAVSGLVNVDAGPVCGVEAAGLVNVASGFQGAQIGGIVDVASGDSTGIQAGLVNVTQGHLRGVQLGLVGVAGDANVQAGLVSVATDTHVQVGLVNVASDADLQVGLVNVDLHGRLLLDAYAKPESRTVLAGIKHGTPHFHTRYEAELNPATGRPWAVLGLGAHLTPADRLYVDFDLLHHVQILDTSRVPNQLSELRVTLGYTLLPHVSAFAGPTFNVLLARDLPRADAPGYASTLADSSTAAIRAWPGAVFGVEGL